MIEKNNSEVNENRFSFVISANDNIVIERGFDIENVKERSLNSTRIMTAVEKCVDILKSDLVAKTNIYNWYTAPQVFPNKEKMLEWAKNPTFELEVPSFVVLDDSDEVFNWNGSEMVPYNKYFNKTDYAKPVNNDNPCVLKFSFIDKKNGKVLGSLAWDGTVYPKFVRNNIDATNSKNKFEGEGIFAPVEAFVTNVFIASQPNLVPRFQKILSIACSYYCPDNTIDYAGRSYRIDIARQQEEYDRKIEASCRKKTEEYFSNEF